MTNLPTRKHIRLLNFDYASEATHFVTICVHERAHLFGTIADGQMHLHAAGKIVDDAWNRTLAIRNEVLHHAFCVMPNHVHALISIDPSALAPEPVTETAALQCGPTERPAPIARRPSHSLATVIGGFKGDVTRHVRVLLANPDLRLWQYRYHDHIVRHQQEFDTIHNYIETNPIRWQEDRYR